MKKFIIILILVLGFFLLLQLTPGIPGGDDGYRHLKFAHLLITDWEAAKTGGWHLNFLWDEPVDIWFFYHLSLAPFTLLPDQILALKIFSTILFGLILFVFWKLLDELHAKAAILWISLLIFGCSAFLYRLALGRAFSLSLLLLLLALLATIKRKPFWLFLSSLLYAWSYSAFFFVLIVPVVFALVQRTKKSVWQVFAGLAGVTLGIFLNPFFPQTFWFALTQSFASMAVKPDVLRIGAEMYPLGAEGALSLLAIAVAWLWAVALYLKFRRKYNFSEDSLLLLIFSAIFTALTVKAARFVEYFVPFSLLFSAIIFSHFIAKVPWGEIKKRWRLNYLIYVPLLTIFSSLSLVAAYNGFNTGLAIKKSPSPYLYYGASQFLLDTADPRATVFNTQWDQFPQLFFWNSKNYYIVGIDPTFMFLKDEKKYWLWRHISDDEVLTCNTQFCERPKESRRPEDVMKTEFGAAYLFLENDRNPKLKDYLDRSSNFKPVYSDEKTVLYKVI